ncbi:hypothetical protein Rhal01_03398 [Rubritalea halochordaticola]|uniref:Uncharacterized protein n=1 Tax=Rubritalea halochordaticola TaxID=714537 RepID=A0ABP9V3L7_9BACT
MINSKHQHNLLEKSDEPRVFVGYLNGTRPLRPIQ